ncbi:MAG: hypothetical protein M1834_004758 [Cirrosporium novae-zelandiae]|nr:MAG: hypothetical protein M1834_004758 [Cirrosporium novae-zelandiae]
MSTSGDTDIELSATTNGSPSPPTAVDGYPSLSDFIARDADAAIYRKFENLSARNLLYLQSEIHKLEAQLQTLDQEDAKNRGNEEVQKVARCWRDYCDNSNKTANRHRELQGEIRVKLKEYRSFLILGEHGTLHMDNAVD